jgi:hypothetical protein
MNILYSIVSTLVLLGVSGCFEPYHSSGGIAISETTERSDLVPGEILVKFKASTTQERILSLLKELNLETLRYFKPSDLYQLRIVNDQPVDEVLERLSSFPEVEYAEPNYRRKALPPRR